MKRRTRSDLLAFAAGALFALGLGVARMTQPAKVIGFLDLRGDWDPSLAFVMVGAIGVYSIALRRGRRQTQVRAKRAGPIDGRLVVGATLFGLGWGMVGYCPGPAVVSIATLSPSALAFAASMLVGMLAYSVSYDRGAPREDPEAAGSGASRA